MNAFVPTPLQALAALARQDPAVQGVLLNPGDRFSPAENLQRTGPPFDWTRKEDSIRHLAAQREQEVRDAFAEELRPAEDWFDEFASCFSRILRSNPLLRKRIGLPIAFVLEPDGRRWVVDFSRSSQWVRREPEPGPATSIEIHLPETLLAAAVRREIHWENLYGSNRLTVKVPRELLGREWELWRMLFNFREGLLQDRLQFFTPRGVRILWRRRQEMLHLARERLCGQSSREPLRSF